ncbi:glycosyltransferase [uncultured Jatrophihabitans sp.]|uniref:glycosyltransferase n=1 Tax=uncultured Jatrophihabitans sp. TaxID=1610747 RepID=UPI0035CA74DB
MTTYPARPIASVIIPAHNEAAVLGRCLDVLLADAQPGEFEVLVAANGCTDATVEVARQRVADGVRVVETDTASKIAGLNLGDRAASVLPRVYLDADVTIATETLRALARTLDDGSSVLGAAPRLRVDTTGASRAARTYLRVWQSLPVFETAYLGSGCYAVSRRGRERFDHFPDVIADDRFINALFARDEKVTLTEHGLGVRGPRTLRAIVRRSVRVRSGTVELNQAMVDAGYTVVDPGSEEGTRAYLMEMFRRPRTFHAALLFAATQVWIRLLAQLWSRAGNNRVWIRDETSRT